MGKYGHYDRVGTGMATCALSLENFGHVDYEIACIYQKTTFHSVEIGKIK
jgi:hypothetical protein